LVYLMRPLDFDSLSRKVREWDFILCTLNFCLGLDSICFKTAIPYQSFLLFRESNVGLLHGIKYFTSIVIGYIG
jgi:hypothetical protein